MTGTRGITYAWLLLTAITVVSWWLAPGHGSVTTRGSTTIGVAIVALGVVKTRVIIRSFMEVGSAPRWLGWTTDAWVVVLWTAILVIYLW